MASESEILRYLKDHDYVAAYLFLINSADNLRNRGQLLKESIHNLKGAITQTLEKIEENPDVDASNKEVSIHVKRIHYTELETIQRLNILIELLAVYYHFIRTDLREIPKAIGKADIPPKELHKEFVYFRDQSLNDVWINFKYPDVESFPELNNEEQKILKNLLEKSAKQIHSYFRKLFVFQERFRPIYNKYKHTLSEMTGVYGINKEEKKLETQIYVRHKQNRDFQTYIIGAGFEVVNYLMEISEITYSILSALIDSALLFLVNLGKDFVPRTLYVGGDEGEKFKEIAVRIKSCRMSTFESLAQVRIDSKILAKFNKEMTEKHVYLLNKDIMDSESILKQGMRLVGRTDAYHKDG